MSIPEYYQANWAATDIDVYHILLAFKITDPCIQHAIKKLLRMGNKEFVSKEKEVEDVINTLGRWRDLQYAYKSKEDDDIPF